VKTVQLTFEKATKNTYRYTEAGNEPIIGTLYVQKSTFEGEPPQEITVTIEPKKGG
jgi:hypothetical protein